MKTLILQSRMMWLRNISGEYFNRADQIVRNALGGYHIEPEDLTVEHIQLAVKAAIIDLKKDDTMRKVRFKKWIKVEVHKDMRKIDGTGKIESDFINKGLFHQWGVEYEVSESGTVSYTVGLIELEDGTIISVAPENIKFEDKN